MGKKRPLLIATFGVAVVSIGACGGYTSGNLIAPLCPDGGVDTGDNCMPKTDAGTTDAGTKDGGTADGGMGGDT
jgi:hypothetical protein